MNQSSVRKKETKEQYDTHVHSISEQVGAKESNLKASMTHIKIQNKVVVSSNAVTILERFLIYFISEKA